MHRVLRYRQNKIGFGSTEKYEFTISVQARIANSSLETIQSRYIICAHVPLQRIEFVPVQLRLIIVREVLYHFDQLFTGCDA